MTLEKKIRKTYPFNTFNGTTQDELVEATVALIKEEVVKANIEHGKRLFKAIRNVWESKPLDMPEEDADLIHWDRTGIRESLDIMLKEYLRKPFEVTEQPDEYLSNRIAQLQAELEKL